MRKFIEQAIERAGLGPMLRACRAGDTEWLRATLASWADADLMALGAVADAVRLEQVGNVVRIHERAPLAGEPEVQWVDTPDGSSELGFLRAVAVARIVTQTGSGARIGVDWAARGLELAQVALGFGASDLRGPSRRKSGLLILEGETQKKKGLGMVDLREIKRQEVAALVTHAGRTPEFVDEETSRERLKDSTKQVVHV